MSKYGLLPVLKTVLQIYFDLSQHECPKMRPRSRLSLRITVWIFQLSVQSLFLRFLPIEGSFLSLQMIKCGFLHMCMPTDKKKRHSYQNHLTLPPHEDRNICPQRKKNWNRKPLFMGLCRFHHSYKRGLHLRPIRLQWTQHLFVTSVV